MIRTDAIVGTAFALLAFIADAVAPGVGVSAVALFCVAGALISIGSSCLFEDHPSSNGQRAIGLGVSGVGSFLVSFAVMTVGIELLVVGLGLGAV